MRFKKTRPALLVALALQQLYGPAFAQITTSDSKNDTLIDATQLPEIKVSGQKVTDDFVNEHLRIGIESLKELQNKGISVKHLRFE